MKRREFLRKSSLLGIAAAIPLESQRTLFAASTPAGTAPPAVVPLKPPAKGSIPVAFLISEGAVVIDFCGPWEVFQDTAVPGRTEDAFRLYTVAETTKPIRTSGGMQIIPDYTYETAPAPKVIVIPAQSSQTDATVNWIRKASATADVTLSVCTGAFLLAKTGLLSGKAATTHHAGYKMLAMNFPDIQVKRGARYVDDGSLATAGGLSSGIDLALHIVERYFGHDVAAATAYQMEYQGQGWLNPDSNDVYASVGVSTDKHPLCAVCEMDVDPATAPTSVYKGKNYYFCSANHKEIFDASPAKFAAAVKQP